MPSSCSSTGSRAISAAVETEHPYLPSLRLVSDYQRAAIKTIRHHLLNLAGKIIQTARQCFWIISARYRYQSVWQFAMSRLASLPFG